MEPKGADELYSCKQTNWGLLYLHYCIYISYFSLQLIYFSGETNYMIGGVLSFFIVLSWLM